MMFKALILSLAVAVIATPVLEERSSNTTSLETRDTCTPPPVGGSQPVTITCYQQTNYIGDVWSQRLVEGVYCWQLPSNMWHNLRSCYFDAPEYNSGCGGYNDVINESGVDQVPTWDLKNGVCDGGRCHNGAVPSFGQYNAHFGGWCCWTRA